MGEFLEKFDIRRVLKYLLFMMLSLVAQNMLIGQLRIADVSPMVLPAVAVSMGMFRGGTWGPLFSLVLGLFADMSFVESKVFFALTLPAISFAAAFMAEFFVNRRFFAFMGLSTLSLFVTALLQLAATAAADSFSLSMLPTALIQTVIGIPFSALAYFPPARWIK